MPKPIPRKRPRGEELRNNAGQTPVRNDSPADALAREIASAFNDEEQLPTYRFLCRKYHEDIVRAAFAQTKAVPDEQIKKSRPALFVFLLKKYALPKTDNSGN